MYLPPKRQDLKQKKKEKVKMLLNCNEETGYHGDSVCLHDWTLAYLANVNQMCWETNLVSEKQI